MRALLPDVAGRLERNGIVLGYEVFGAERAGPTVLLLPTWTIVHARVWKLQVPYLARRWRVVTYDGPGNGASERSTDPARYALDEQALDAVAVLDACGVARAVVVGVSLGAATGLRLAGMRPDLVAGLVLVAAALPLATLPERSSIGDHFHDLAPDPPSGWDRYNLAYWYADYPEFASWFFEQVFSEPHSTKAHEDAVGWALETRPECLEAVERAPRAGVGVDRVLAEVRCPLLWIHSTDDRIQAHEVSVVGAQRTGAPLVSFAGAGHLPNLRDPVRFNLLVRAFVERVTA
jgi:pimeloyl-ACP methyl ester carboxylesterase